MAAYLEAALEEADPALIAPALRGMARAKGLAGPQRCAAPDGEETSSMFAKGEPGLAEFLKATRSLGLRLHASGAADGA
jgi:DNA-binding phage protein